MIYKTYRNYNPKKCYVKIVWSGDFQYPDEVSHRTDMMEFEYDHLPTETEIIDIFKSEQKVLLSRSDWTNVIIEGYTITPMMTKTSLIIK